MDELESKTNAQRAQGGLGLLSHTISVQKSQESILLILERRDGVERQREERGVAPGRRWCGLFSVLAGARREERGEEVFKVPTQGVQNTLDSN